MPTRNLSGRTTGSPTAGTRSLPALGFLLLATLIPFAPGALVAQEEAEAILRGQVLRAGEPASVGPVILHRVAPDSAGTVDSVAVAPDGTFTLRLPRVPDPLTQELYFASIRFRDILYFGRALSDPADLDSLYVISVHDTAAAPEGGQNFTIAVRNVFLEAVGDAWRVTDLFEIRNDTDRTIVSVDDNPVWVYPLPPGASDFQLGQSDLSPDAAGFSGHIFQVSAPVPPGERLYVIRYTLPSLDVTIPAPGTIERMEILVKEPAPPLSVSRLQETAPVELDPGSTYRRFAGPMLAGQSVVIVPGQESDEFPVRWLAVILGLLLGVVGLVAFLRGQSPAPAVAGGQGGRSALLLEIAQLDEWFQGLSEPDQAERAVYERRRGELKERLQELD